MQAIINQLELSIKSNVEYGWNSEKSLLLLALICYSDYLINENVRAVEYDQLLVLFKSTSAELSEMNASQLAHIVKGFVSSGLLDKRISQSDYAFDADLTYYHPANQSVVDFLVAHSAFKNAKLNSNEKYDIPASFVGRFESLALYIQMLNEQVSIYIDRLIYSDSFTVEEVENAQLLALSRSFKGLPPLAEQWLSELFVFNKKTNRRVLDYLIIPSSRNTKHWCGSRYLHDVFKQMSVAERDILWSCLDYLPEGKGNKWDGFAKFTLDDIDLYPEDQALGMPLLIAWSCASVVVRRFKAARAKLALWGCDNTSGLAILLREMEQCNDSQILECLLTAAAGASCRTADMDGLLELSKQCHRMFFSDAPMCSTRNSACRHAARIVIERAHAYELVCSGDVEAAKPPYQPSPIMLPFVEKSDEFTDSPIRGDLEWYVVKKASNGFFEEIRTDTSTDDVVVVPSRKVVLAVFAGRISIDPDVVGQMKAVWAQMELNRKRQRDRCSILSVDVMATLQERSRLSVEVEGDDEEIGDAEEFDGKLGDVEIGKTFMDFFKPRNEVIESRFSEEAQGLLDQYIKDYGLAALSPDQLRDGLILSYVQSLGWEAELFYGKPSCGSSDEILGVDLAITKEYRDATHGARSQVMSLGEKYVWLGVNEVAGDFADRMPTRDICDDQFDWVTSYADVGKEMADPFDTEVVTTLQLDENPVRDMPNSFWSDYKTTGETQAEKSENWVNNSPWPEISKLIVVRDGLRICSWLHGVESDAVVSQHSRITCLLVPRSQLDIFRRDAVAGVIVSDENGGDVSCAGIGGSCYPSPSVICWAPWVRAIEGEFMSYDSVDEHGDIYPIQLRYLSAKTYWSHSAGETLLYFPSPDFSSSLGIVRGDGSKAHRKFTDIDEQVVASFDRVEFGLNETVEELIINCDALDKLLDEQEAVAVWVAEVYREVPPELIPDEDRKENWPQKRMSYVCIKESGTEIQCLSAIEVKDSP